MLVQDVLHVTHQWHAAGEIGEDGRRPRVGCDNGAIRLSVDERAHERRKRCRRPQVCRRHLVRAVESRQPARDRVVITRQRSAFDAVHTAKRRVLVGDLRNPGDCPDKRGRRQIHWLRDDASFRVRAGCCRAQPGPDSRDTPSGSRACRRRRSWVELPRSAHLPATQPVALAGR